MSYSALDSSSLAAALHERKHIPDGSSRFDQRHADINNSYELWHMNHTYDTSWTGFNLFVWALLECHLAIIFACAPSLRAFVRKYLGESFSRTFRSSSNIRSQNGTTNKSQNASTLRNSTAFADPEIGKVTSTVHERVLEKQPSSEALEFGTAASGGGRSSFTITNPDEYEAYNMRQLNKHRYMRRDTNEDLSQDWNDPKRRHDVTNAVSFLSFFCRLVGLNMNVRAMLTRSAAFLA